MTASPNGGPTFEKHIMKTLNGGIEVCKVGEIRINCNSPAQYADQIVKYADEAEVDPRLLLSVLLQEGKAVNGHGLIEKLAIALGLDSSRGIGNMGEDTFNQVKRSRDYRDAHWSELSDNPVLAIRAAADYLHDLSREAAGTFSGAASGLKRDELIGAGYRSGSLAVNHMSRGQESAATRQEMLQYVGYIREQWAYPNTVICGSGAFTCSQ